MYEQQNLWGSPQPQPYLDPNRPTAFSRPYGGYAWEQPQASFGMTFGGAQPVISGAQSIPNIREYGSPPAEKPSMPGGREYWDFTDGKDYGVPTSSAPAPILPHFGGSGFSDGAQDFSAGIGSMFPPLGGLRPAQGALPLGATPPQMGIAATQTPEEMLGPPPPYEDQAASDAYWQRVDRASAAAAGVKPFTAPPVPGLQAGYTDQQGQYHPGPDDFGSDAAASRRGWDNYSDNSPPGIQIPPGRIASRDAAADALYKVFQVASQSRNGEPVTQEHMNNLLTPTMRRLAGADFIKSLYPGYNPALDPAFNKPLEPEEEALIAKLQSHDDTQSDPRPGNQYAPPDGQTHRRQPFLKALFNFAPPSLASDPRFQNVQHIPPGTDPNIAVQNYLNQYEELEPGSGAWQPYVAPPSTVWSPVYGANAPRSLTRRDLRFGRQQ